MKLQPTFPFSIHFVLGSMCWGGGASWGEVANHWCFQTAQLNQLNWPLPSIWNKGQVNSCHGGPQQLARSPPLQHPAEKSVSTQVTCNISWRSQLRKDTTSIFRPSISTPNVRTQYQEQRKPSKHIKNADGHPIVFLGHRSNRSSAFEQVITCRIPARARVSKVCCKNLWFGFDKIYLSLLWLLTVLLHAIPAVNQCSDLGRNAAWQVSKLQKCQNWCGKVCKWRLEFWRLALDGICVLAGIQVNTRGRQKAHHVIKSVCEFYSEFCCVILRAGLVIVCQACDGHIFWQLDVPWSGTTVQHTAPMRCDAMRCRKTNIWGAALCIHLRMEKREMSWISHDISMFFVLTFRIPHNLEVVKVLKPPIGRLWGPSAWFERLSFA